MFGWIGLLLGCPHGDSDPPGDDDDDTVPTGDTAPPLPRAACAIDTQNLLRVVCLLDRDGPGPIAVRLTPEGGETLTLDGDPEARDVRIVALDLLGGTSYAWELDDRGTVVEAGTIVIEALPDLYRPLFTVTVDGPSSIDRVLFSLSCGLGATMYVSDAAGRIRWYQGLQSTGFVSGFDYTDWGTIVAMVARARILEWDLDGTVALDVGMGEGLERIPHHAVVGRQGRILALDTVPVAYPDGKDYLVDGVSVVDGQTSTHVWDIGGIVDPQGLPPVREQFYWAGAFPGAVDFAHENAIDVLPDGDWLISLKHLDTILRIDTAGNVRWSLSGMPTAAVFVGGPALELRSSVGLDPTFQHPHNPNFSPWGTLLVVDNGSTSAEDTRVLELLVDEDLGVADVIRAWDLGVSCPVQSSAFGLPDGTILATCARTRELFELDDSGIRRRTEISCADDEAAGSFVRVQPVPRITGFVR